MQVENFDLKWAMCSGGRRFHRAPWWSEAGKIPQRAPRRVDIEIVYYDPREYNSPLTGDPLPELVVRFTQKIRLSSWKSWRPMERLSVSRFYAVREDPSQHWSPNRRHGGWRTRCFQNLTYDFDSYNRDHWFPVEWAFLEPNYSLIFCCQPPPDAGSLLLLGTEVGSQIPPHPDSFPAILQKVDFITPRIPPPRISYQF